MLISWMRNMKKLELNFFWYIDGRFIKLIVNWLVWESGDSRLICKSVNKISNFWK